MWGPGSVPLQNCVLDHLSEPVSHTFISLNQARELVKDKYFNKIFTEDLAKYSVLKATIQDYISNLEGYKEDLNKTWNEIVGLIDQKFQAKLDLISKSKTQAVIQLEMIKRRMNTFITGGDELLSIFEERGLYRKV
jgi:hypothetical protein